MLQNVLLLLLDCGIKVHLFSLSEHLHNFIFGSILRLIFLVTSNLLSNVVLSWQILIHIDILLVEVCFSLENVLHIGLFINLHLFLFLIGMDIKVVHFGSNSFVFKFRLDIF